MSGLNTSTVEYDERAEIAIRISSLQNAVSGSCNMLKTSFERVGGQAQGIQDMNIRGAVERSLEEAQEALEKIQTQLQASRTPTTSIAELRTRETLLRAVQAGANTANTRLNRAFQDAVNADLQVPKLREFLVVAQEISDYVDGHEDEFLLWCSKAKDSHKKNVAKLRFDLEACVQSARENGRMEPSVLEELRERTNALKADHARYVSTIDEFGAKHQRRIYLYNAVKAVCEELNFAQRKKPFFLDPNDAYSPMQLEFDTRGKGILSFTFPLEGEIHSESAFPSQECQREFEPFSKWLNQDYGVSTNFHPDGPKSPGDEEVRKPLPEKSSTSGGKK